MSCTRSSMVRALAESSMVVASWLTAPLNPHRSPSVRSDRRGVGELRRRSFSVRRVSAHVGELLMDWDQTLNRRSLCGGGGICC